MVCGNSYLGSFRIFEISVTLGLRINKYFYSLLCSLTCQKLARNSDNQTSNEYIIRNSTTMWTNSSPRGALVGS
jgi:hypothetical protein